MDEQQDQIYQEGYNAYLSDESELSNPYTGLDAEFWSDGWEDGKEDNLVNEVLAKEWHEEQKEQEKKRHKVHKRILGIEFLKYCHFPMYYKARLRRMLVGDLFFMGQIRLRYEEDDFEGVLEIYIRKEAKQVYHAYSSFTLPTKPTRSCRFHELTFKIEKGGVFAFTGNEELSEHNRKGFALTCRYFQRLKKHASPDEVLPYRDMGMPDFLEGVNFNKKNTTTEVYYPNKKKPKATRYQLTDNMMPKPMMECILDIGLATGAINFNQENEPCKEE